MRINRQLQGVPDASAQPGGSMLITRTSDGVTVGSALTDSEGFATIQTNGSPGPIKTLFTKGNRWQDDSRSIMPTGSMDLCELQHLIKFLHGDGIILGYGSSFAITSSGSGNVTLGTGAVVLDGVLSVHAAAETISAANGDIALVVQQMHSNGRTQLSAINYADVGSTTCVPLWRATISGGSIVGSATWIATPTLYNGIVQRHPTVDSIVRVTSGSTTNASGEASGLETTITLEVGVVYNVAAHASVITRARHGSIALKIDGTLGTYQSNGGDRTVKLGNADSKNVTGAGATTVQVFDKSQTALTDWVLLATYGSFGSGTSPNFNTPAQVAVNSAGKMYIADTGNNRLVRLNSDGTHDTVISSLTGITGVCVDASDNVYTVHKSGGSAIIRKYNSSLVQQWTVTYPVGSSFRNVATDSTHVYYTAGDDTVLKNRCSDGGGVASWGSAGSGNGQFNAPWGIAANVSFVWVVDSGNNRIQKFLVNGDFVSSWAVAAGCRGVALGTATGLFLACNTDNTIYHTSTSGTAIDSFSQASPDGVAVSATDVVWVSNAASHNVAKFDETASAFTYDSAILIVRAIPRT